MQNIGKKKMAGGRPRTTSFTPEEMIELGEEMVKWVSENDPLHLSQWYTIHKRYTYNEWKQFISKEEFRPYYEIALKIVGMKYLDGESKKIKQGIAERWQRVYFKDLREDEDETAEENSQRKVRQEKEISIAQVQAIPPYDSELGQFHENLRLKARIRELEDNANGKSQTTR